MENEEFFSSTKSENLRRVLVLFLSTDWIGVGYLKTRNTLDKSINIRFVSQLFQIFTKYFELLTYFPNISNIHQIFQILNIFPKYSKNSLNISNFQYISQIFKIFTKLNVGLCWLQKRWVCSKFFLTSPFLRFKNF